MTHQTTTEAIATIGIDLGKNTFHLIGMDARGRIVLRRKIARGQLQSCLANVPVCLIGMEACAGAHHVGRQLAALGHDVRLLPAQYVKPFLKGHKNDYRDAEAIAEAVAAADHAAGAAEVGRATRSASPAPGAQPPDRAAHGGDQPDPRLPARVRHPGASGACRLARGPAHAAGSAHGRALAAHDPPDRGSGGRLAAAGRAHRDAHPGHHGAGPAGCGLPAADGHPGCRGDHRQRHGGGDWNRSRLQPKAATSPPGSGWCPSRSRPATARSWAASPSVATATCAPCSWAARRLFCSAHTTGTRHASAAG